MVKDNSFNFIDNNQQLNSQCIILGFNILVVHRVPGLVVAPFKSLVFNIPKAVHLNLQAPPLQLLHSYGFVVQISIHEANPVIISEFLFVRDYEHVMR